jgi:hypothetical protein
MTRPARENDNNPAHNRTDCTSSRARRHSLAARNRPRLGTRTQPQQKTAATQ